jgi:putative transposase
MAGIASNHGFEAIKVGGVEDHAPALSLLLPALPFAKAVQALKSCSSKWINDTKAARRDFAWQEGYGAFSVSASQTEDVIRYIAGQAAHHAKRSYEKSFSIS